MCDTSPKMPKIEAPSIPAPPPPPAASKAPQSTPVLQTDKRSQGPRRTNPLTINKPVTTGLNVTGRGTGVNVSR